MDNLRIRITDISFITVWTSFCVYCKYKDLYYHVVQNQNDCHFQDKIS